MNPSNGPYSSTQQVYESASSSFYSSVERDVHASTPRSASAHLSRVPSPHASTGVNGHPVAWPIQPQTSSESACSVTSSARSSPTNSTRIPVRRRSGVPVPSKHLHRQYPLSRSPESILSDQSATSTNEQAGQQLYDEDGFLISSENEAARAPPIQRSSVRHVTAPVTSSLVHSHSVPIDLLSTTKAQTLQSGQTTSTSSTIGHQVRRVRSVDRLAARAARVVSDTPQDRQRRLHAINTAPQGPPPWLSKYAPDPSLPSDQQLLPTVAKKLARERASMEGGQDLLDVFGVPVCKPLDAPSSIEQASLLPAVEEVAAGDSTPVMPMLRPGTARSKLDTPIRNFSRRAVAPSTAPQSKGSEIVSGASPLVTLHPQQVPALALTTPVDSVPPGHERTLQSRAKSQGDASARGEEERMKSVGCCVLM